MVTSLILDLRAIARRLAPLHQVMRKTGMTGLFRKLYVHCALRRGIVEMKLKGERLRFAVKSVTELRRIDSLDMEDALLSRLIGSVRAGDVFFDIGANIGVISILAAKKASNRHIRIHAFEPEPRNAAELRRNVSLNRLDENVAVHEVAIGAANGRVSFRVSGEEGEGSHSMVAVERGQGHSISVALHTLDDFCTDSGVFPDVLKIDVEGAEMDVLRGAENLFAAGKVREIVVEIHPAMLGRLGLSSDDIYKFLGARGFGCSWKHQRDQQIHSHFTRA